MPKRICSPALFLCLLLFSCSSPTSNLEGSDNIDVAKKLWKDSNLSNYSMEVERHCFCGGPLKFRAIVQNGKVIEVIDLETDEPYKHTAGFKTIDDIFNWLEDVAPTDPQKLDLKFNPALGYPTFIDYNQSDRMADEELLMKIKKLQSE